MPIPRLLPATILLVLSGPIAAHSAAETPPKPLGKMVRLVQEHQADAHDVAAAFGLPGSSAGLERQGRLQAAWLTRLEAVAFDALGQPGKIDYVLLRNELERSQAELARREQELKDLDRLAGFRTTIVALEEARRQTRPVDSRAAADAISNLAGQVKQLRQRVEQDKPLVVTPATALRTAKLVKQLQGTLKTWFDYHNGYLPEFDWWVRKPYEEAGKELQEYEKLLREKIAGQKGKEDDPLVGEPIGADALAAAIRFEFLPYTAEELIALGQRELAWGERQMKAASRQMGLGDDWKAALARVKADYVPPGQQGQLVARVGRQATAFVRERKLVVVPPLCEQTWRLSMMSPEEMKTTPYVAYGGLEMYVAYAQESMSQEDKRMVMRGNNRHFVHATTPHELIPGHHLQRFYASRYATYRAPFSTPFYVEGWALYWELRLWDLGWATTPEDRIGMLFWRMHRAARIIVTLNYHLGRMKPEEMVDFLVDRVGHERFGATSEVRRYLQAPPLYQASYLLGGLQLKALHDELVGNGKMTEERFHAAVLKANAIPIELLRAELLGLPLTRNMRPAWKFAGAVAAGDTLTPPTGRE